MKMKDFNDTEATIIDFEPGKGKRKGTLGKFIMLDSEGVSSAARQVKAIHTTI